MYRGQLVETAPSPTLFAGPAHPYTWALLSASIPGGELKEALKKTFGFSSEKISPSNLANLSPLSDISHPTTNPLNTGCLYLGCPLRENACLKEPPQLSQIGSNHFSRCRLAREVQNQGAAVLAQIPASVQKRRDQSHLTVAA
jgi:ABC-type dipeptide/oligopeptide/nickel transport system ATPase component